MVPMEAKIGLSGQSECKIEAVISKNFYLAGETVYLVVKVDNSQCSDACSLIVSHRTKYKLYQSWTKDKFHRVHKKERFFLCDAGE